MLPHLIKALEAMELGDGKAAGEAFAALATLTLVRSLNDAKEKRARAAPITLEDRDPRRPASWI